MFRKTKGIFRARFGLGYPVGVELTPGERDRYERHLSLPEVREEGQKKLKAARILLIGAGGLGSPAALYLAAAGVGTLGIVDGDHVDVSNLQRQILHGESDVGRLKTDSARGRLAETNPRVRVVTVSERLTASNALEILKGWDAVLNGADNFPTRYLVSDACQVLGIPHVHGAVYRFDGEVTLFPPGGPCYRCLHPSPPGLGESPSCAEAGVLGALPGAVGTLQALEALKWTLGLGDSLAGRLLVFDALSMRFREMRLQKDPNCPACGSGAPGELRKTVIACAAGREKEMKMNEIDALELKAKRDAGEEFLLIDVREPDEWAIGHLEGATLVPLATVPARCSEWDLDAEIVLMCRSGKRSADALAFLAGHGFTNLTNLRGGILGWSDRIDPSIPKY